MLRSHIHGLKTPTWVLFSLTFLSLTITCYAGAIPTTDLVVRSTGDVSLSTDMTQLEERFNGWAFAVGSSILAAGVAFIPKACALTPVTYGIPCFVALGAFAVGAIITAVASVVKDTRRLAVRTMPNTVHRDNWLAEYETTGKPVIVAHHDCYGPGCLQSEYSLHTTYGGRKLHRVLTGTRQKNNGTNHVVSEVNRRDPYYGQAYDDYTPPGGDMSDELFFDYLFEVSSDDAAYDMIDAYDDNSYDAKWSFAGAIDTPYIYDNGGGYYCFNIGEPGYGAGIATSGYAYWGQGQVEQDPDNEDAYIQECAGQGQTSDYRTYEFDGRRRK